MIFLYCYYGYYVVIVTAAMFPVDFLFLNNLSVEQPRQAGYTMFSSLSDTETHE